MTKWINIKDKLPEKGKEVLAASVNPGDHVNDSMYIAWIDSFGIKDAPIWVYSWCCGCHPGEKITHWKELPEKPNE